MAKRDGRLHVEDFAPYDKAVAAVVYPTEAWRREIGAIRVRAEDEENDLDGSPVYLYMVENACLKTFTNFSRQVVEEIWLLIDPIMAAETSTMDELVIYLSWLKTGAAVCDYLSKTFRISETRLEGCLNRVRPALQTVLRSRWWKNRKRPVYRPHSISPLAALVVDSHTTPICQTTMPYEEAKVFYDGVYGFKTEITISTLHPHYCLFTSPSVPASMHDYELHKLVYRQYLGYLHMTPEETIQNEAKENAYWLIMGDKDYVGPADDTFPIERVVSKIERERMVVEKFLSRST